MYLFVLVAVALGLYFLHQAWQRPSLAAIVTGVLWLAYAVWEFLIGYGVLCDANCNIRVDLLLFWPVLAAATLFASHTPGQRSVVKKTLGVIGMVILALLVGPLVYVAFVGFPDDKPAVQSPQPNPK